MFVFLESGFCRITGLRQDREPYLYWAQTPIVRPVNSTMLCGRRLDLPLGRSGTQIQAGNLVDPSSWARHRLGGERALRLM